MSKIYDMIIIGAGPAGLTAALYAGRSRLSVLLIEKAADGGQIAITSDVENYPGQKVGGETGPELIERFTAQAEHFGAERVSGNVSKVELEGEVKKVYVGRNEDLYEAKTVVLATGAHPRKLEIPGEAEFTGKGVSYCATCDANFFEDFEVFVIGGGDSAVEEAMYLTNFARKVYLVHRRDELRAAKSIQERAFRNEKLEIIWDSVPERLEGEGMLSKIVLRNRKTDEITEYEADEEDGLLGCFVFVGNLPNSELFKDQINCDERGYAVADEDCKTNIPGVYVVGDVRVKSLRQVVTAAADGAIAAMQAEAYLAEQA